MAEMCNNEAMSHYESASRANPRIRIVRLDRTRCPTRTLGFSLRGGREFGTGFFVSNVEKGSEADIRGLRTGDEIYQVNGYKVNEAVHHELVKFICSQDRLTLRVRAVGVIPVKEYPIDPLTWEAVNISRQHQLKAKPIAASCSNLQRITLTMAPKMKLGCGICKGPEWKPGIFVQFTKECGVARNAGLRPGDQIISCNGVDFTNIPFSEAVALMKQSSILDLMIKTSEGADLFPTESSGYNSSASSTATGGDQSPCWENQKRLSIVREESTSSGDRKQYYRSKNRDRKPVRQGSVPNLPGHYMEDLREEPKGNNTTIIKLSENGTLINNIMISNYASTSGEKSTTTSMTNSQVDVKTVKVEVHQSVTNGGTIPPPPPTPMMNAITNGSNGDSLNSPQQIEENTLKCALFEEIKRRTERKDNSGTSNSATVQENGTKKKPSTINSNKQHDALIEEFKLVHSRMFKNNNNNDNNNPTKKTNGETNGTTDTNKPERLKIKESQATDYRFPSPGPTPTPDYDSTSCDSIERKPMRGGKPAPGTLGRMAAMEHAKASGEILEIESIESLALTTNGRTETKFPEQYFAPAGTGPATMKKANLKVANKVDEFNMKSSIAPAIRSTKTPERTKEKNKVRIMLPKDH